MSVLNIVMHKPEAPPLAACSVSWKRILLRAPILWCAGVLAMILASAIFIPSSTTATATTHISVLVALWVVSLSVWTGFTACVFWLDVFRYALQPAVLTPALTAAMQWSLDDMLQFVFNPQWVASIVGAFLLPTTLYTLPTTPEQRAQVLCAAGLLPPTRSLNVTDDSADEHPNNHSPNSVFTEPGSWRYLLPMTMQRLLVIESENSDNGPPSEEDAGADEATDDEDDSHGPYSISPVWKEHHETSHDTIIKSNQPEPVSNQPSSVPAVDQGLEPHEIIYNIVTDLLRSKIKHGWSAMVSPQRMGVVAATAVAVLTLQLRHSATARGLVKHLVHGSVTAGAGTALVASLTAVLAPYCLASNRPDALPSKLDVNVWLTSVMTALVGAATATVIPRPFGRTFSYVQTTLSRIPWKGAAAVLVLALFRQRHRRRLERS
jgi:hypothetical protein